MDSCIQNNNHKKININSDFKDVSTSCSNNTIKNTNNISDINNVNKSYCMKLNLSKSKEELKRNTIKKPKAMSVKQRAALFDKKNQINTIDYSNSFDNINLNKESSLIHNKLSIYNNKYFNKKFISSKNSDNNLSSIKNKHSSDSKLNSSLQTTIDGLHYNIYDKNLKQKLSLDDLRSSIITDISIDCKNNKVTDNKIYKSSYYLNKAKNTSYNLKYVNNIDYLNSNKNVSNNLHKLRKNKSISYKRLTSNPKPISVNSSNTIFFSNNINNNNILNLINKSDIENVNKIESSTNNNIKTKTNKDFLTEINIDNLDSELISNDINEYMIGKESSNIKTIDKDVSIKNNYNCNILSCKDDLSILQKSFSNNIHIIEEKDVSNTNLSPEVIKKLYKKNSNVNIDDIIEKSAAINNVNNNKNSNTKLNKIVKENKNDNNIIICSNNNDLNNLISSEVIKKNFEIEDDNSIKSSNSTNSSLSNKQLNNKFINICNSNSKNSNNNNNNNNNLNYYKLTKVNEKMYINNRNYNNNDNNNINNYKNLESNKTINYSFNNQITKSVNNRSNKYYKKSYQNDNFNCSNKNKKQPCCSECIVF